VIKKLTMYTCRAYERQQILEAMRDIRDQVGRELAEDIADLVQDAIIYVKLGEA
jgi:hypothetical protein